MPKQVLNGADVGAALQQVRSEGMTKSVGADGLGQAGAAHRHLDGFIDDARVHMMAAGDAGAGVDGHVAGGEDILPAPCGGRLGIFSLQRMRQIDRPMALGQILLVQRFDPGEVILEERNERGGKGREAILIAFPRPDGQLLHREVEVLDAELDGFHNA